MPMNRTHMRRQLYKGGGITNIYPRQKFGVGSWWQDKKDKAINVFQKVVPNELADIAVKAAPFVAPFNPGVAGLMRGLGRLDQRGNLTDALKQGLATTAFGAGTRYLGGASPMGGGLTGGFTSPIQQGGPISKMWGSIQPEKKLKTSTFGIGEDDVYADQIAKKVAGGSSGGADPNQTWLNKVLYGEKGGEGFFKDKGLIGKGGGFDMKGAIGKGLPAVYAGSTLAALAVQKAMGDVGEREPGESLEAFNKRRKGTVSKYLDYYYRRANKFRIAPENMDAAAEEFVEQNTKEYVNQGGRVGLQAGGISMSNTFEQNLAANQAQANQVQQMLQAARSRLPGATPQAAPAGITSVPTPQASRVAAPQPMAAPTAAPQQLPSQMPMLKGAPQPMPAPPSANMSQASFMNPNTGQKASLRPGQTIPTPPPPPGQTVGREALEQAPREISPVTGEEWGEEYGGDIQPIDQMPMMPGGMPGAMGPGPIGPGDPERHMAQMEANEKRYGTTAEGKSIDPMLGRQMYMDMLNVVKYDQPNVQLTGNETLAELEKLAYPQYFNQGGRVGLRYGTGIMSIEEDKLQAGAPPITYEGDMRPTKRTRFGNGSKKIIDLSTPEGEAYLRKHNPGLTYESRDLPPWMIIPKKKPKKKKRTKQLYGTGPNGLPGIPRMAPDGMEYDMRQNGGFQGLGAKEGKDDVPAMLAKNEFVFTADAVKGAGNGDIELGAQRMYDTMKNLEKRMA